MPLQPAAINTKIKHCAYLLLCITSIIIGRLFYLQFFLMHDLLIQGQKNFLRLESISSPRGNILDCNGKLLATNRPITNLFWDGTGNKALSDDQNNLLQKIETITCTLLHVDVKQQIQHAEKTSKKILLVSDISFDQLSKIVELFPNNPNIHISTHFKRFYPHQTLASHILGYISQMNFEAIGKMGLEKMLEQLLRGEPGQILKTINSIGTNINQQEIKKALAGHNIVTTLDLDLQMIAEEHFPTEYQGCLIVMDPANGAIRALVSRPYFDPNAFLDPLSIPEWQALQTGQPFLNRAFNASYPPASIFKLVSLSAALEHHLIYPSSIIYCQGFSRFKGRAYRCAKKEGHGPLSIQEAFAKSCNILFFDIAKRISVDILADYAQRFGLGTKVNIMFPEKEGIVPSTQWKLKTKGERWWPGETISVVIGQSYSLATPIQVARMIGSIFEGYLVKPRILEDEPVEIQSLRILNSTREFLKQAMKAVVNEGTGIRVRNIKDIEIYAKTGTAQTSALEKRELGTEFLEHAWFVAHVQYKNTKPLILVILIENAGSSIVATTAARHFLKAYRAIMEQKK